jgi:hypothetical protein
MRLHHVELRADGRGAWRSKWKTFIQALELGSQTRKGEQRLVQMPLSKPIMPPSHCRVPDDCLCFFEIKFSSGT